MAKLESCPFCQETKLVTTTFLTDLKEAVSLKLEGDDGIYVRCTACYARGPHIPFSHGDKAAKAQARKDAQLLWNTVASRANNYGNVQATLAKVALDATKKAPSRSASSKKGKR